VGVGVEEAVFENLLQIGVEQDAPPPRCGGCRRPRWRRSR
jgi:hypothetical protein